MISPNLASSPAPSLSRRKPAPNASAVAASATAAAPPRPNPRVLAGAAILQIVPALRDDAIGHAAMDTAVALLQAGARTIIAGDDGPLVGELRALGGEFLPLRRESFNPVQLRSNARFLHDYVLTERIDVVHAHSAAAAWSALGAVHALPVWLVTSFPDRLIADTWLRRSYHGVLARGDRVIAPSSFISLAMIERYKIAPDRITVIPRAIDIAAFSPAAVLDARIGALRRAWGVLPEQRVVLVPGALTPENGQMTMIDAVRLIVGNGGGRNLVVVFAGDDRADRRHVRALHWRAGERAVDTLLRFVGPCADAPAALAAADIVAIPALQAPDSGAPAAQAQAMGRPTIVTAAGVLPEHVLFPPRMPEDLRTGWVVRPGNAAELAQALAAALALDRTAYAALGARARQFAEFMFSPRSVAEAVRGVYTSLLARDP